MLVTPNSFSQCSLLVSTFKCIIDSNNCEKHSQRPIFLNKSKNQGRVVIRQISPYVSIIQPFRILIGMLQNLLNKALRKSCMLGYFKWSKY